MPNAARVGDPTTHGGVITGPGAVNVLIGGMPAAVLGDLHTCGIPSPPHVPPGPFISGSATVMIGGRPAVRNTDVTSCGAMPIVGCPTVIIGG